MATSPYDEVSLPRPALDAMLEDAAERGARKALASVGLDDPAAAQHVRGLRDLFDAYQSVRKGALRKFGEIIAYMIVGGLALLAYTKWRS
ncbi:DUF6127 family protein [Reyranella sp.]|uniref:DUF6127 family protein n=1 Tax=Reyranella sp. TaxID=1929291 RepID=UPI003BA88EBF